MVAGIVIPIKSIYVTDNYKVFSCDVKKESVKNFDNNYTITLAGDMPELIVGVPYNITAEPKKTKYGITYYAKNVLIAMADNGQSNYHEFLKNITTERQFASITNVYPNFVNLIISDQIDEIKHDRIYGVGEKQLKKIVAKVVNNLVVAEIINEYSSFGVTFKMAKKLYDKYGNITKIKKEMELHPYKILCSISGISFKTADAIVKKKRPDMIDSEDRLTECIKFILEETENSEGSTYIEITKMYEKADMLVPEAMKNLTKVLGSPDIKWDAHHKRISRKVMFDKELFIAKKLLEIRDAETPDYNWGDEPLYETFRCFDGITLTDEQMSSLKALFNNNVVLLRAGAGMGKSSSTKAIVNMLDSLDKSVVLLAPTGAASEVLSEYTGRDASTIHREIFSLLMGNEISARFDKEAKKTGFESLFEDDEDIIEEDTKVEAFTDNELEEAVVSKFGMNKIGADVIIIDECSMINTNLMYDLIGLIDSSRTKIMFVQDTEQLPAIGAGRLSMDIIESGAFPVVTLTKVFRYTDGGLMMVASDVREGRKYTEDDFDKVKAFGGNKDYVLIKAPKDRMLANIKQVYSKLIAEGATVQEIGVISAMNIHDLGTIQINKALQELMIPSTAYSIKYGDKEYRKGDKVVQLVNNYKAVLVSGLTEPLFNGNQGIISDIDINNKIIYVDYGKRGKKQTFVYGIDDLNNLGHAYALSVHKFQGSSAKYIIYVQPSSHTYMSNKNLLYTALTRTKTKCYHIVENVANINQAIKKSENKTRNTYLKEMIIELDKMKITA